MLTASKVTCFGVTHLTGIDQMIKETPPSPLLSILAHEKDAVQNLLWIVAQRSVAEEETQPEVIEGKVRK